MTESQWVKIANWIFPPVTFTLIHVSIKPRENVVTAPRTLELGQRSRSISDHGTKLESFCQWSCLQYECMHTLKSEELYICIMAQVWPWTWTSKFGELWSLARQQLWPWRRSKVKVEVTTWRHLKGLVTRIMHAKYQWSTFNTSEDMSQVKVFVTDRQRDGQRDGQTDGRMRLNVPTLLRKRGTKTIIDPRVKGNIHFVCITVLPFCLAKRPYLLCRD